jgi:protein-L-isoaspartate(D-aspartate) O-methyltransferase
MTACFAQLAGPTCRVYGVEHVAELVEVAKENIRKCDKNLLDRIEFKQGDGFQGWAEKGPFDIIYFGAAAPEIPQAVLSQLKPNGRMLLPIGGRTNFHTLTQIDVGADGTNAKAKSLGVVRFTPLTGMHA